MQVAALIAELAAVAEKETGVKLDEGLEERLCAYARSVAHYPTAVKEVSRIAISRLSLQSRGGQEMASALS